ncbi:MAG: hypothetical protein CSB24_03720, partial [Deltaproteobacteria bacterium]
CENDGRRKVLKTMVGGASAVAAYNLLPAKWGKPYVESIFLPAHAATSGTSVTGLKVTRIAGDAATKTVTVRVSGSVSPAMAGVPVTIVATPVK